MLIQRLLTYLAPFDCLNCGSEGRLLCAPCALRLPTIPERCYRCHAATAYAQTCVSCRSTSPLHSVYVRTAYAGSAKQLVWQLKFSGARDGSKEIADQLAPLLPASPRMLIVPAVTATSRARQRGYDQAQLIAKELARRSGLPYSCVLRRLGQHHQVGAGRDERHAQMAEAYRCVRSAALVNAHVLLVDDVLTTGATLEAAAQTLLNAGARRVSAVVFAQA